MRKILLLLFVCITAFGFEAYSQTHFGNGSDGSLTVANGVTYYADNVRSAITGDHSTGSTSLELADGTGFSAGDEILIITMQDAEVDSALNRVGIYEFNKVSSVSGNVLNLASTLLHDFISSGGIKHQAIKINNFTDVTVDGELTCNAWNGSDGGILFFRATDTVTVNATGSINANGKGYRGGTQYGSSHGGGQAGESFLGIGGEGGHYTSDPHGKIGGGGAAYAGYNGGVGRGSGGGGSTSGTIALGDANLGGAGGGGGGHAGSAGGAGYGTFGYGGNSYSNSNNGQNGGEYFSGNGGNNYTGGGGGGGGTYGEQTLTKLYLGCGGGCGGHHNGYTPGFGGNGGGILYIAATSINNQGNISSNANNGNNGGYYSGGGGGGAGGSLYLNGHSFTSSQDIYSNGGNGGNGSYSGVNAGNGGQGRIRIDYHTYSNTGTMSPVAYESTLPNILHQALGNTGDITGPYSVDAFIYDDQGDPITTATVHYRVNSGTWQSVSMTSGANNSFSANIPGQAITSEINYYISASDGTDNYLLPENAPTTFFTFSIILFPPTLSVTDLNNGNVSLNWEAPAASAYTVNSYKVYRSATFNFTPNVSNLLSTVASDTFYNDNSASDFHTYYYKVSAVYNEGTAISNEVTLLVNNQILTTVLGYVYLEGQSNHANIKIRFEPISPSAVLDSTYTDALGYFETTVNPGTYNVTYEKANYQTLVKELNFAIVEDYDFGQSTILMLGNTNISGNVSGVWNGINTITGDITIPNGDSLIIEAGSEIRFLGNYNIYVYGYFSVEGTQADSVLFTSAPSDQVLAAGQWQGIDFYNDADDNSSISYAIIQYAVDGIYIEEGSPSISHTVIHYCTDRGIQLNGDAANPHIDNTNITYCYDGLYNYNGQPNIYELTCEDNSRYGLSYDYYAHGTISNSTFNNNTSYGLYVYNHCNPTIDSIEVNDNGTTGLYVTETSSPNVSNSHFAGNSGHGIELHNGWSNPRIINCVLENNTSAGLYSREDLTDISEVSNCTIRYNGTNGIQMYRYNYTTINNNKIYGNANYGIYIDYHTCFPYINHNLIAYNGNDGIHKDNDAGGLNISYNTIYGNTGDGIEVNNTSNTKSIRNNIIVNNQGYGLRNNTMVHTIEYNDLYSNALGEILNTANLPASGWDFVSFNAIGDTADIYLNISEEPSFVLNDTLDFYLNDNSHCINVGDASILDPDNTASDIGYIFHNTGVPPSLSVTGFADQSVSLAWEEVDIDSLVSYNVYYKLNTATTYTLFVNTANLTSTVTGLTNNVLYDFTITGVFANSESDSVPKVSERPGVPSIAFNPTSFNVNVNADTVTQNLSVVNNGSRNLFLDIPQGMENGSMHCDGSYDYIEMGDQSHLEGMTAFTIEANVKFTGNGHSEFVSKHYRQYSLYIDANNKFGCYKGYNDDQNFYQSFTTDYVVQLNEWYHLAVRWQNNDIWFYVNGAEVSHFDNASDNAIPVNDTYSFRIGGRANEYQWLNGDICEVRVWNYARTPEEIDRYKNSSVEGTEAGLLGYWPLHSDYNDHSTYAVSASTHGNVYLNSLNASTFLDIPYILPDGDSYTIAPSTTVVIPFKFWDTGETGTFLYTQTMFTNITGQTTINYEMALSYGTVVPATPVHFSSVPSTGLPYTIVITDAMIDGSTIDVGDEIAVFDGTLCVGAGIFDGSFNFVLTAWEADPGASLAGYTDGNTMTFKIYDTSADLDAPSIATYSVGDGTFGFNEFSALSLNGTVYIIQEVPITAGAYNLISFNLLPRYSSSSTVFGGLQDLQIVYNDAGGALIPPYSINTIGDIYFLDGYHAFSTTADTIFYEGTSINPYDWGILVEANKWNSISFLGEDNLAVTSAFDAAIVDSISIVQTSDGTSWIPGLGINTIGNLHPGTGYQIALSSQSDVTVYYQTNNGNSKELVTETPEPNHFSFKNTGLPYQIVVENPTIEDLPLAIGDELAVFDGNVCVGASVYTGQQRVLLTAWAKDDRTKLPGFESGHEMIFKIYSIEKGEVLAAAKGLKSDNNLNFSASDYAYISLNGIYAGINNLSCYPNPFNDKTNISISLENKTNVYLRVVDISGRVVKIILNTELESGNYNFDWTGDNSNGLMVPTGIYFIELNAGEYSKTEKLIRIQ